ncbi:hypothetical protein C8J56DRAFT_1169582 [Mycena floridula]|nr:hypothetical protein C8J56DRAFT_1169582 [Mycena floridula]
MSTVLCDNCGSSFISRDFSIPDSLEKLRSGHNLTDFETCSILAQLPTAAAELGRCDAQISRLRLRLGNLELRNPEHHLRMDNWRLEPNATDHHESDFPFVSDFTEPEKLQITILSGVCAFWRDIAVIVRQSWSNLGDLHRGYNRVDEASQPEIQRSASYPHNLRSSRHRLGGNLTSATVTIMTSRVVMDATDVGDAQDILRNASSIDH